MKPWDHYRNEKPWPAKGITGAIRSAMIVAHQTEDRRIVAEFWADCRKELGYERLMNQNGVAALEKLAWDEGHANGFSEVYLCLCDYLAFAKTAIKNRRRP